MRNTLPERLLDVLLFSGESVDINIRDFSIFLSLCDHSRGIWRKQSYEDLCHLEAKWC